MHHRSAIQVPWVCHTGALSSGGVAWYLVLPWVSLRRIQQHALSVTLFNLADTSELPTQMELFPCLRNPLGEEYSTISNCKATGFIFFIAPQSYPIIITVQDI